MTQQELPSAFLRLLNIVTAKRPRTVIDHIIQYGQITTEELRATYGYNHPPRAIRDVREHGIPITTFRVTGSDGRRIAAYRFGDPSELRSAQLSGRTALSARLKASLIEQFGPKFNIYLEEFPERELQIDHRVPFEIAGDASISDDASKYMLLCPSANRAKSWSCEHCENWHLRDVTICQGCYWAYPENYSHVAMRDIRRLDLVWSGDESSDYDRLQDRAMNAGQEVPHYVKQVLKQHLDRHTRNMC